MDERLETRIKEILETNKTIADKISSDVFWLEKGREALRKFQSYSIEPAFLDSLIEKASSIDGFKEIKDSKDSSIAEIREMIFTIVAYCDQNASGKRNYNEYSDFRVIAKAGIRQNDWVKAFLRYKKNDDTIADSAMNAIEYLDQPVTHFGNVSENHRKMIAKNILKIPYDRASFFDSVKNFFVPFSIECRNPDNLGTTLGQILYDKEIMDFWLEIESSSDELESLGLFPWNESFELEN